LGGAALLVRELYIPIKRRPLEEVRFPARWFLLNNAMYLAVMGLVYLKHPSLRLLEYLAAALVAIDICGVGEWLWNRRFTVRSGEIPGVWHRPALALATDRRALRPV
jgi:hypothetical protein